jgi:hypothetical protein
MRELVADTGREELIKFKQIIATDGDPDSSGSVKGD